ncbi:50S ribosomal protein L21 [bacterium]|uniref:Large ribosomal subunit protein bL21 n=2 Tax=Katanobacteria TaxID=422282 RepID=A0A2M7X1K7_UNCKA|nr:50S ribosomal protein L21 [bacterium]PIP56165.1 MAG: 50S ribosomal protein L21 [candidate division WWE3 bacterium CG22_combo_CG10-13_8_21_14_all_39_12]PJA40065.1 MAG: 50S ribosomal protein L21 [candidate division WWE3 bacterium CG_4_9_14_3_um_filter_39_7]
MEYAVIQIGKKQYIVEKDQEYTVEKLDTPEGESITFDEVPLYVSEKGIDIGKPFTKVKVDATVVEHKRATKVVGLIYKTNGHRRKFGHKQHQTVIKITNIA